MGPLLRPDYSDYGQQGSVVRSPRTSGLTEEIVLQFLLKKTFCETREPRSRGTESIPGNQAKLVKRESSRPCPGQRCRQCITCLVSRQFATIGRFSGERMCLVTGIRVKCGSANKYKEFGKTERHREERLGSWAKDKRARQAALSSLRKQIKKVSGKGGGAPDEKSTTPSSVDLSNPGLVVQPDQTTDEGYTRLQEVGGSSAGGSLADLREVQSEKKKDGNCCGVCTIM